MADNNRAGPFRQAGEVAVVSRVHRGNAVAFQTKNIQAGMVGGAQNAVPVQNANPAGAGHNKRRALALGEAFGHGQDYAFGVNLVPDIIQRAGVDQFGAG